MPKRALALLLICASLPVMMAALLSPGLRALQHAFRYESEIQLLSKLVLMTPALAIACSAGLLGFLSDRLGRYPMLLVSLLIFGLFGMQGFWADDIYGLILTRFGFGLGVAGIMTATSSWLASTYQGLELRRMISFQAGLSGAWGILFQLIGGGLAEISWRWPFLLYAVSFPIAFFLIFEKTLYTQPEPSRSESSASSATRIGWPLLTLALLSASAMSLFVLIPTQGPQYFHTDFGIGPRGTAMLISVLTASSSLASLLMALWRRQIPSSVALIFGLLAMGFGFQLLPYAERWRHLAVALTAIGGGLGIVIPCIGALIGTYSPARLRGRWLGALLMSNYIGQFLSPLWSQGILEKAGPRSLFFGCAWLAVGLAASVFLVNLFTLERRRRES